MTDEEAYHAAFSTFAQCYPHEAAEMDWERFVKVTREVNPVIPEDEIRRLLRETEDAHGNEKA